MAEVELTLVRFSYFFCRRLFPTISVGRITAVKLPKRRSKSRAASTSVSEGVGRTGARQSDVKPRSDWTHLVRRRQIAFCPVCTMLRPCSLISTTTHHSARSLTRLGRLYFPTLHIVTKNFYQRVL